MVETFTVKRYDDQCGYDHWLDANGKFIPLAKKNTNHPMGWDIIDGDEFIGGREIKRSDGTSLGSGMVVQLDNGDQYTPVKVHQCVEFTIQKGYFTKWKMRFIDSSYRKFSIGRHSYSSGASIHTYSDEIKIEQFPGVGEGNLQISSTGCNRLTISIYGDYGDKVASSYHFLDKEWGNAIWPDCFYSTFKVTYANAIPNLPGYGTYEIVQEYSRWEYYSRSTFGPGSNRSDQKVGNADCDESINAAAFADKGKILKVLPPINDGFYRLRLDKPSEVFEYTFG